MYQICSVLKRLISKETDVLVLVAGHLLQRAHKLVAEHRGIDVILVRNNNLGHAEPHIWDVILCGLQEYGNDVLSDWFFADVGHHCS